MKLPHLKYNAAELASLTVLLAVAGILAAVLLARSCKSGHVNDATVSTAADSIATVLDNSSKSSVIRDAPKKKRTKNKKANRPAADRQPVSRDYLDEPVNE